MNWETIPDSLLDQPLPLRFFNPIEPGSPPSRQRGLVYNPGSGEFVVSANKFANTAPEAAEEFEAFSGTKVFANPGSALWEIGFEMAGQPLAAGVKGFGLVFSDVDLPNSASLEFFNGNKSLGKYFVPAHDAVSGFSFLGAFLKNDERITSIKVNHDGFLSAGGKDISDGGTHDLIVMDDFLYSEPIQ